MRIFLAIARTGTLTAAAEALKISQPTTGRRLRTLEEACGFVLFQRTSHGFYLTDEGKLIRLHAERMEEEATSLERRLLGAGGTVEGKLRLSASEWFSRLVLTPAIAAFCRENPNVSVELLIESRVVDLERQEADLVFRFPKFESPAIIQKQFTEVTYDLFASQDYIDRTAGLTCDSTLHRLIGMDAQLASLPDAIWLRNLYPNAAYAFCSNGRDLQAEACSAGVGLAVLPTVLGTTLGLVALTAGDGPPRRVIRLGYHADLKRLKRLRALLGFLDTTVPRQM
ncbi:LysR family transcriptional regulator [Acetobacter nitrogenifigens]|uniref:LysR family transcriptional regulator n=1 Tax=Acetobacter nitrogenifigens TaxID=285268 RepID=UPI001B7FA5C9|nr:LysR family transcriptional regulator [Acetobacter nitrogenifigens]